MDKGIDIHIELANVENMSDEERFNHGQWLDDLKNQLRAELEINWESKRIDSPLDTQDGGITIAIAIAGLSLSIVNTVLAIVKYNHEKKQRGSITITLGENFKITKSNLSDREIEHIIQEIQGGNVERMMLSIED